PPHPIPFPYTTLFRSSVVLLASLLGVRLDVLVDPVHERVGQARLDGALAPGEVLLADDAAALHRLGERDHPLGRVGSPVEDDVLDRKSTRLNSSHVEI